MSGMAFAIIAGLYAYAGATCALVCGAYVSDEDTSVIWWRLILMGAIWPGIPIYALIAWIAEDRPPPPAGEATP